MRGGLGQARLVPVPSPAHPPHAHIHNHCSQGTHLSSPRVPQPPSTTTSATGGQHTHHSHPKGAHGNHAALPDPLAAPPGPGPRGWPGGCTGCLPDTAPVALVWTSGRSAGVLLARPAAGSGGPAGRPCCSDTAWPPQAHYDHYWPDYLGLMRERWAEEGKMGDMGLGSPHPEACCYCSALPSLWIKASHPYLVHRRIRRLLCPLDLVPESIWSGP